MTVGEFLEMKELENEEPEIEYYGYSESGITAVQTRRSLERYFRYCELASKYENELFGIRRA